MSFAEKMLEMLTSSYNRTDIQNLKEKQEPQTNIGKLFSLAGWGFDLIRDQTEKVRLWDDIDTMRGSTLTRYGDSFGVTRGEASDEILRIMIKVKIIAMLSSGDLDAIIWAAASLFDVAAEDVMVEEIYPAKVYLYIDEDKLDQEYKDIAGTIAALMKRIKAAGVGIRIFYKTYSGKEGRLYAGTAICMATFLTVYPNPINKGALKQVKLKTGVGTLIYSEVSYPVIRRE